MLALVAVPASAGIYALAPFIVPVLLGQKWIAGVPVMEILAFNGALLLIHSSICTVLIGGGYPDRVTKTNGLYVLIMLILFALLIPSHGLVGAAFSALVASVLSTPIYLFQVRRTIGVPASTFVRVAARPFLAAMAMIGLVRWIMPEWSSVMNFSVAIGWLLGGVAIGATAYATAISVLWVAAGRPEGAERTLFGWLWKKLLKRRAAPSTPTN